MSLGNAALIWRYGIDRALQILAGFDDATNADIRAWRRLGDPAHVAASRRERSHGASLAVPSTGTPLRQPQPGAPGSGSCGEAS